MSPDGSSQPQIDNTPAQNISTREKWARYAINASIVLDAVAVIGLVVAAFLIFKESGGSLVAIFGFYCLLLALLPAVDGYVLHRYSRSAVRRGLWTYFSITRSAALLLVIYSFYYYAATDVVDNSAPVYTAILVAASVLWGLTGIALYRLIKGRWQLALLLAMAVTGLASCGYINKAIAESDRTDLKGGLAAKRHDYRTARDFQLLSQDIEQYTSHGKFPSSLRQAANMSNSYSSKENVVSRLGRYGFRYDNSTGSFELCAAFLTDTASDGPGGAGPSKAYRHRTGYQCFSFEVTGWSKTLTPATTSNPAPSSSGQGGVQIFNLSR